MLMVIDWAIISPTVVGVLGMAGMWLTAKIQHKGRPENALIDQLQEEMVAMRGDISTLKLEQSKAKRREMIRDNYINKLREHINAGNPPPPPEWPEGLYE
jgi:outer membrane murein-binding lipoprotein Lpp